MRLLATLVTLALMFAGCTAANDGSGSASFYVKDAPTDEFDELHVVFTAIEVHGVGNNTNGTSGWFMVYQNETGQDVDLLNASGAQAAFLGEANLTAGKYTQIRIHATEVYGVIDNETVPVTLSNGVLKVVKSFTIAEGEETRIVLDFDLDRALKQTGQDWRMTPVVGKTFVHTVNDDESGSDVHQEGEVVELEGVE